MIGGLLFGLFSMAGWREGCSAGFLLVVVMFILS